MAQFEVIRSIAILVCKLDMSFQPNFGSSFYRLPNKKKLIASQRSWKCPVGTLRLSDHWNYKNYKDEIVYRTDLSVSKKKWALAINYGPGYDKPWHIVQVFEKPKQQIDFNLMQRMVKEAMSLYKK